MERPPQPPQPQRWSSLQRQEPAVQKRSQSQPGSHLGRCPGGGGGGAEGSGAGAVPRRPCSSGEATRGGARSSRAPPPAAPAPASPPPPTRKRHRADPRPVDTGDAGWRTAAADNVRPSSINAGDEDIRDNGSDYMSSKYKKTPVRGNGTESRPRAIHRCPARRRLPLDEASATVDDASESEDGPADGAGADEGRGDAGAAAGAEAAAGAVPSFVVVARYLHPPFFWALVDMFFKYGEWCRFQDLPDSFQHACALFGVRHDSTMHMPGFAPKWLYFLKRMDEGVFRAAVDYFFERERLPRWSALPRCFPRAFRLMGVAEDDYFDDG